MSVARCALTDNCPANAALLAPTPGTLPLSTRIPDTFPANAAPLAPLSHVLGGEGLGAPNPLYAHFKPPAMMVEAP
jgi:hypothetical protein